MSDLASTKPLGRRRTALMTLDRRWLVLVVAALVCAYFLRDALVPMSSIMLSAMVSSIAGFAFSAICGATLFHLIDNHVAVVQIMMTCSIANQASMTWAIRHDIDWRLLGIYLCFGLGGIPIGVWILLHTDPSLFKRCLGIFLLIYGTYMLVRKPMVLPQSFFCDACAGFLGGITGGALGFPGASVTIWCGTKGWDKVRQRAVFQPFILITQCVALLAIGIASGYGKAYDPHDLLFVPAGLLGTSIGLVCFKRMSDGQFAKTINLLLIASGLTYTV